MLAADQSEKVSRKKHEERPKPNRSLRYLIQPAIANRALHHANDTHHHSSKRMWSSILDAPESLNSAGLTYPWLALVNSAKRRDNASGRRH